jgi:hypothetical protein
MKTTFSAPNNLKNPRITFWCTVEKKCAKTGSSLTRFWRPFYDFIALFTHFYPTRIIFILFFNRFRSEILNFRVSLWSSLPACELIPAMGAPEDTKLVKKLRTLVHFQLFCAVPKVDSATQLRYNCERSHHGEQHLQTKLIKKNIYMLCVG